MARSSDYGKDAAPLILPTFEVLARNYPADSSGDAVRLRIGGAVASLAPQTNTCAIRLSRALNYAGKMHEIPAHGASMNLLTRDGGDHKHYLLRVAEVTQYLNRRYGPPAVTVRYAPTEIESSEPFRGKAGIICWHITGWDDATGHLTLWDGTSGLYEGSHDYFSPQSFPFTARVQPSPRHPQGTVTVRETGVDLWRC